MKSLRVNAAYEAELYGLQASSHVSEAIEFLALFLSSRPLYTQKKYSAAYLDHIQEKTGHRPILLNVGDYENWWGSLKNISVEQKLNSKVTCAEFLLANEFGEGISIVTTSSEIEKLKNRPTILKAASGMSGMGNKVLKDGLEAWIQKSLEVGPIVAEPLWNRKFDFSTYVFSQSHQITYQNLVDSSFQYKGSIFTDVSNLSIENLSFYPSVSSSDWERAIFIRSKVSDYYLSLSSEGNFCLDSFIYESDGQLRVRPVCEVNSRRTMGLTAYQLSKKFSKENSWSMFVLGKSLKTEGGFATLQKRLKNSDVLILSPGDSRFEMFLITAANYESGKNKFLELSKLLPECQFSVEI